MGLFVFGFSIIFTAMGASASALGAYVVTNRQWLGRVAGFVVVLLGVSVFGIVKVPGLYREHRLRLQRRPRRPAGGPAGGNGVRFCLDASGWIRRNGRVIEVLSGVFLIVMGGAMVFDLVFRLNTLILRLIPFRPAL